MNYFWKTKIIKILIKGNDFANKINLICAFCFFFALTLLVVAVAVVVMVHIPFCSLHFHLLFSLSVVLR